MYFCENSHVGKAKLKNFFTYLLWFYLFNRCNFSTLTSHYGKFNPENMYETLSELASFCKRYDKSTKHLGVFSQFAVLTAVHLQNANAKFHKVE